MLSGIPAVVAMYLASEKDVEKMDECFAADARVHDEAHDHVGIEAIKKWKREANEKYQYVVEPLDAAVEGTKTKVRTRVSGNFPGSPVELSMMFTVKGEKIVLLEIG